MAKLHAQALKGIPFFGISKPTNSRFYHRKRINIFAFQKVNSLPRMIKEFRSLFTAHTTLADENLVEITCRGHSAKSAKLLAKLVLDTYEVALLQESIDAPLPGFTPQRDKRNQ